jgi:hypothetical protein
MGQQIKTNVLQVELPLGPPRRVPHQLDLNILYSKTTFLGALQYVVQCGNFENDKQVRSQLGIDAGNWSRMMNGDASFPQDKEEELQSLCGNQGLVLWRAYRAGKGVYDLQEAKDKRISELEAENRLLKTEIDTLVKYGVIQKSK